MVKGEAEWHPSPDQTDEDVERALARPDAPELLTVIWRARARVSLKTAKREALKALRRPNPPHETDD